MADGTAIEWTDATWNPITGCSVVSPGCTNCYAMRLAGTRLKHIDSRKGLTRDTKAGPVWTGEVRLNKQWLYQPFDWKKPRRVFVCAHGDLFAENVPDEWILDVFTVMAAASHHTYQVLTKRAGRMREFLSRRDLLDDIYANWYTFSGGAREVQSWPLHNVWLGVSAEDQKRADERVPELLATPAKIRFVSAEPLLGPIDFEAMPFADGDARHKWSALTGQALMYATSTSGGPDFTVRSRPSIKEKLDWIIVGGESGPGARPMHPAWVRSIRNQCAAAGVPFFFKQWGQWQPRYWCKDGATHALNSFGGHLSFQKIQSHPDSIERVGAGEAWQAFAAIGKKAAGRTLDGVEHSEFPKVPA